MIFRAFFASLEPVCAVSLPGASQGPGLRKALCPPPGPQLSPAQERWWDGLMAFTGFLMVVPGFCLPSQGDRSELTLPRTKHRTNVFSVFAAGPFSLVFPPMFCFFNVFIGV